MPDERFERAGRIFINYRREDTAYAAGWLFDRLSEYFGDEEIFKDVDSIDLGDDFTEKIKNAVASCDVFIPLIGDRWLTVTDASGGPRIHAPDDFVRIEIEAALERGIRVIPILVDGADMPPRDRLPPSIASMTRRQALELSPARFDFDVGRLLAVVERTLATVRTSSDAPAPAEPSEAPVVVAAQETSIRPPGEGRRHSPSRAGRVAAGVVAVALLGAVAVVASSRGSDRNGQEARAVSSTTPAPAQTAETLPPTTSPPTTAPPTTAPPTTPPPPTTVLISPQTFSVIQTCDIGPACGVQLKAGPSARALTAGGAREGERVTVVCQIEGERVVLDSGESSVIWNRLDDGRWISDLFVDTGTHDFLSTLPRCSA